MLWQIEDVGKKANAHEFIMNFEVTVPVDVCPVSVCILGIRTRLIIKVTLSLL